MIEKIIAYLFLAAFLGLIGVVIAFIWYWIKSEQDDKQRLKDIGSFLARQNVGSVTEQPFPQDLPEVPIVKRRGRPKKTVHGTAGSSQIWVFEHSEVHNPPQGRNVSTERHSDSSPVSRHTVACLQDAGLSLPLFEILPNFGSTLREVAKEGLDVHGGDSSGWEGKLLEGLLSLGERMSDSRTPIQLGRRDDFAAAYNVFTEDSAAVSELLTDEVMDWLLKNPGMIVSGRDSWLLVSRNVRLMPERPSKDIPFGILSAHQAGNLVHEALELEHLLLKPTPVDLR